MLIANERRVTPSRRAQRPGPEGVWPKLSNYCVALLDRERRHGAASSALYLNGLGLKRGPQGINQRVPSAIQPDDLDEVARRGFRTVICNRRPGEAEAHPDDRALSQRAAELGLGWRCIPVTPGKYDEADIKAFGQAIENLPTPMLAFCGTGKRAVHL